MLGNQSNYTIGRLIGPKVFQWEDWRWFNKRAFNQAHEFYERYGGVTIVIARFMPSVRTFAPSSPAWPKMTRSKFTFYDVTGGALWVGGIVTAGLLLRQRAVGQAEPGEDHLGDDHHPGAAGDVRRVEGVPQRRQDSTCHLI